jgi:hypothetical protein
MKTMIQGRDGISLAHARALKLMGVARQLSLVAAVLVIAALVAGTAGTSYAKNVLLDTVVVSNYGAAFAGSIETFAAGSNAKPKFLIQGTNTLLGIGTGAAGDAQSSLNGDIAVTVPLVLLPIGLPNGFVEIYPFGANGNSSFAEIIASPAGFPDLTGLSLPQGVAFEDPFDGLHTLGLDIVAVSNYTPAVVGPDLHIPGLGLCAPNAPGFSLGTITEYDKTLLIPGVNDIPPLDNSPVIALTSATPPAPYSHNATIGGCDTYLLGPVGLAFDAEGFLSVVDEAGAFVTVYEPGAHGNALPIAFIGAVGAAAGAFKDPMYVAVKSGVPELPFGFPDDVIYVTDAGDNSIKIFAPFTNCFTAGLPFACEGTELGVIQGGSTKLKRPEGIALSADGNLYVVNNNGNSLNEYANVGTSGGDIPPTLIISGKAAKMNLPVGVALPQFPPPAL